MTLTVATIAAACLVLLAAGYLVLGLLGQVPALAPAVRAAWPILFTETLIVGAAVGAFWLGGWVLSLALLAHAARVGFEAARVAGRRARLASPLGIGLGLAALAWVLSLAPPGPVVGAALTGLGLCIVVRRMTRRPEGRAAVLLDLAIFPVLPLLVFTAAGLRGGYGVWLLTAFLLVETFDSYALLGGRLFGRRRAFPVLSPNKTVEGLGVGAAMLMLTAAVAGAWLAGLPVLISGAVALFVGVLTVAGDLAASRLKRLSGVKDYPAILPHQGGLLDITDAWIAAGAGLVTFAVLFGAG